MWPGSGPQASRHAVYAQAISRRVRHHEQDIRAQDPDDPKQVLTPRPAVGGEGCRNCRSYMPSFSTRTVSTRASFGAASESSKTICATR